MCNVCNRYVLYISLTAQLCHFYRHVQKVFFFSHFVMSFDDLVLICYLEKMCSNGNSIAAYGLMNSAQVCYSFCVMCRLMHKYIVERACVILLSLPCP